MSRRVIVSLFCLSLPLALGACSTAGDLIASLRSERPDQVVDGPRRMPSLNQKMLGGGVSLRDEVSAPPSAPAMYAAPMPPPAMAMEPAPPPPPPVAVEEVRPAPVPTAAMPVVNETENNSGGPAWADQWFGWLKPPAPYSVTPADSFPLAVPKPEAAPEPKPEAAADEQHYAARKPLPGNPPLSLETETVGTAAAPVALAQNDAAEAEEAKPVKHKAKRKRKYAKKSAAKKTELAKAAPEIPADDKGPQPDASGKTALAVTAPKEEKTEAAEPQPTTAADGEGKPDAAKNSPVVLAQMGDKKEESTFPRLQDVPPAPPALQATKNTAPAQRMDLQNTHDNAMQEKTALENAPFQSIQNEPAPAQPAPADSNENPALALPPVPPPPAPPSAAVPVRDERKPDNSVAPAPADAAPALPMPPAPPPPPPPSGQRSDTRDTETLASMAPASGRMQEEWQPDRQSVTPFAAVIEAMPSLPSLPARLPESRYLQRHIAASVHMALE